MKFVILNCIGLLVVNPVLTSTSEEEESSEPETNFIWYPKGDGTGVVKAYLDMPPVHERVIQLSDEEKEKRIRFLLFRRETQHDPRELFIGNPSNLRNSGFFSSEPVKILIHGFQDPYTGGFAALVKDAYLTYLPVNVIAVDWGPLVEAPWYLLAAESTRIVGYKTASLIQYLLTQNVELSQIHVIGHSLGAHAAGFAGKALNGNLQRITGIDPAAPLFDFNAHSDRLYVYDARFVDVIHTAGGLSIKAPTGHVDFYPNNGNHQPGCGLDSFGICAHRAGYKFFAESIQDPYGFRSCKCPNWALYLTFCRCPEVAYLGDECSSSSRGKFYLSTNGHPPFARG